MIITQNIQNISRYQKIIGHLRTMWSMRSLRVRNFTVEPVDRKIIQSFIHKWHYSHDTNGVQQTQCFALFDDNRMIGAMIYAIPSMPATAARYNRDNPEKCWELRRLCCIDDTPTNTGAVEIYESTSIGGKEQQHKIDNRDNLMKKMLANKYEDMMNE